MEKSINFEENLTRNIWKNLELAQVEPRQLFTRWCWPISATAFTTL